MIIAFKKSKISRNQKKKKKLETLSILDTNTHTHIEKFPGLGPSHSCDYAAGAAKPDPLSHCTGPGSEPRLSLCSWILNP